MKWNWFSGSSLKKRLVGLASNILHWINNCAYRRAHRALDVVRDMGTLVMDWLVSQSPQKGGQIMSAVLNELLTSRPVWELCLSQAACCKLAAPAHNIQKVIIVKKPRLNAMPKVTITSSCLHRRIPNSAERQAFLKQSSFEAQYAEYRHRRPAPPYQPNPM